MINTLFFGRCLGNRQSFSAWQRERIVMSFESKQAPMARQENEQTPQTRKDHTGKIDQITWDKGLNMKARYKRA